MNENPNLKDLQIKTFSNSNLNSCARLYADVFGSPPWNEHWTSEKALILASKITGKKDFIGFSAEYNGVAVAYLLGYRLSRIFPLNRIYYLNELFVDTGYQNMKVGKRLVGALLDALQKESIPWLILLTKKDAPAEAFYKKIGFKRVIHGLSLKKKIIMAYSIKHHI